MSAFQPPLLFWITRKHLFKVDPANIFYLLSRGAHEVSYISVHCACRKAASTTLQIRTWRGSVSPWGRFNQDCYLGAGGPSFLEWRQHNSFKIPDWGLGAEQERGWGELVWAPGASCRELIKQEAGLGGGGTSTPVLTFLKKKWAILNWESKHFPLNTCLLFACCRASGKPPNFPGSQNPHLLWIKVSTPSLLTSGLPWRPFQMISGNGICARYYRGSYINRCHILQSNSQYKDVAGRVKIGKNKDTFIILNYIFFNYKNKELASHLTTYAFSLLSYQPQHSVLRALGPHVLPHPFCKLLSNSSLDPNLAKNNTAAGRRSSPWAPEVRTCGPWKKKNPALAPFQCKNIKRSHIKKQGLPWEVCPVQGTVLHKWKANPSCKTKDEPLKANGKGLVGVTNSITIGGGLMMYIIQPHICIMFSAPYVLKSFGWEKEGECIIHGYKTIHSTIPATD